MLLARKKLKKPKKILESIGVEKYIRENEGKLLKTKEH